MRAVERVTAAGEPRTPDLGGRGTTEAVTQAVCAAIVADNE
jgi:tartrate dehydrogenase/decarboxylase/D-malate dehydrogenase